MSNSTLKYLKKFLLVFLLWVSWVDIPEPPIVELDSSWQAVLSYSEGKDYQFGKDIVFSYGPYGWLLSHYILPQQLDKKLFYEIIIKFIISSYIVFSITGLKYKSKLLFILLYCLSGIYFTDNFITTQIVLIFYFVLCRRDIKIYNITFAFIILSFYANTKFTFTILVSLSVILAFIYNYPKKSKEFLITFISFPFFYLLFWFYANQEFHSLHYFFLNSVSVTKSYSIAMGVEESFLILFIGFTSCIIVLIPCFFLIIKNFKNIQYLPLPILFVLSVFLVWKHGFVRADHHVLALFGYFFSITLILSEILHKRLIYKPFLFVLPLSFVGIAFTDHKLITHAGTFISHRFHDTTSMLFDINSTIIDYNKKLKNLKSQHDLSPYKKFVRNGTIDTIDSQQAVLLLNNLNYRPRPIIQNYKSYSNDLIRINSNFFASTKSPDFIFWKHGYIDNRFPSQGDSILTAGIPYCYNPLFETPYGLLMERKNNFRMFENLKKELIYQKFSKIGYEHILNTDEKYGLWLTCNFKQPFLGALRSFLYKPPILHIEVTDVFNTSHTHRIIPSISSSGFLIHPFLKSQYDLKLFSEFKALPSVKKFRFKYDDDHVFDSLFWEEYEVKLYKVKDMPLEIVSPHVEFVEKGISNRIPISVNCIGKPEFFYENEIFKLFVHAPSEVVFEVFPSDSAISGTFGLRKESYRGSGTSDGVEFCVYALNGMGSETEIWKTYLEPNKNKHHQGNQTFKIDIPIQTSKIIIRFSDGKNADLSWDWSYLAKIQFK